MLSLSQQQASSVPMIHSQVSRTPARTDNKDPSSRSGWQRNGRTLGQCDDEAARTEGRPRPDKRMGYLAELAHHRRPARRRARHPHAQRACPSGSLSDPQTWGDVRAEPAVHGVNPPGAAGAQPESSATAGSTAAARPAPEVLVTVSANIPGTDGKPVRHARRPRIPWLRALPLLAQPIIRT